MNINPSDTDVRQGYALAESGVLAASNASQSSASNQAAEDQTPAQQMASAQAAPPQASAKTDETDARSKAAQASADKTTAKEVAAKLGQQFQDSDTGLKIRVLDDTGHTIQVEVVDKKSNKVLRQIPQDEMLKLSASMKEMTGVLLNKPA
ncbi:MAG: hypothetical protein AUJ49_09705 [Desulfovibrionaceae bacterium CG1_02_65_16]|nr:MAG: hypothetical protein AUJ49_09705 [Desulfovibrionaceae bacterium CG1_02_65_16]